MDTREPELPSGLLLLGAGKKAVVASGGSFTVHPTAASGYISSSSSIDPTFAYSGVGSSMAALAGSQCFLGQFTDGEIPLWECYETCYNFDLSGVTGTTCTAGTFSSGFVSNNSDIEFIMEMRGYNWGDTLTTGDFVSNAVLGANTLYCSLSTSGINTTTYQAFTESGSALRDAITAAIGGTLRVMINSSEHRLGNDPGGNSSVIFEAYNSATRKPKLEITTT